MNILLAWTFNKISSSWNRFTAGRLYDNHPLHFTQILYHGLKISQTKECLENHGKPILKTKQCFKLKP